MVVLMLTNLLEMQMAAGIPSLCGSGSWSLPENTAQGSYLHGTVMRNGMFSRTKWQGETAKYTGRIAALMLVTPEVEAQMKRFPGLLRKKPDDLTAVKHRMLIFANHSLSSACELLLSVKPLLNEGHQLAAGHCIRLLFEVWGSLLYAQASVLKKAAKSSESAAIADARLQRLLLGTNSGPLLPAGMQEDIHVINVMDFVRAGETAVQGFTAMYEFLCDVSHPTYMHSFLYWLKLDASWSNDHNAREMHRILEKVTKAAEMAIGGISTAMIEIYDECLPDLEEEIASYRP
jgi:hypothetical protein